MLSLHLSPLTTYKPTEKHLTLLDQIPKRHFTDWLNLPEDQMKTPELIKKFIQKKKGEWDKIIVLGMGGSALGITTLQKALSPFDNRLTVLDNLDSTTIDHYLSTLDAPRTLILVISKSGSTLETMTQFEIFKKKFTKKQYQENFIVITDPEEGPLRKIAEQDGLASFPIPPGVGGRFSVLSSVGLLPAALMGWDVKKLLKGASDMKKRCLKKTKDNPALQLALAAYELSKQGKNITTLFTYSDKLFPFGLWYQQLLAESIGKSENVGLTPLPLRGVSDQHSVLQLLQDGPNDKLNIFLDVVKPQQDVSIPNRKQSVHQIMRAECQATEQALSEDGRPTIRIEIPEISEYTLGELFFLFEMQVALLGELFGVDAYNQPGVEKSKKIVKSLL